MRREELQDGPEEKVEERWLAVEVQHALEKVGAQKDGIDELKVIAKRLSDVPQVPVRVVERPRSRESREQNEHRAELGARAPTRRARLPRSRGHVSRRARRRG